MSSAGEGSRDWRFYATDMIEFAEEVRAYTSNMDQAAFVDDSVTYDATLRNLESIGELNPRHQFHMSQTIQARELSPTREDVSKEAANCARSISMKTLTWLP